MWERLSFVSSWSTYSGKTETVETHLLEIQLCGKRGEMQGGGAAFKLSHRPAGLSGGRQPAMQPGLWKVGWWREGMEVRPVGWECGCCISFLQSGDLTLVRAAIS